MRMIDIQSFAYEQRVVDIVQIESEAGNFTRIDGQ